MARTDDTLEPRPAPRRLRRRILILPTAFTTGNLFFGYYSVICSMRGDYDTAAKLIGLSWLCDILDGKIARMANATSDFGLQFDSLADVVAFGVAPSVLLILWGLQPLERQSILWVAGFIYLVCAAMRLARFNVSAQNLKSFAGMPSPAAGTLIAAIVYMFPKAIIEPPFNWLLAALTCGLGALMISTIRYPSLKFISLTKGKSHLNVFLLALLIVAIFMFSQYVLLGLAVTYASSGAVMKLYAMARRRRHPEPVPPLPAPDAPPERH